MPTESEYPDYAGCPLLIVEDNKVNQIVARKILSKANFTVSLANNGQEAMEMVQNQAFELVLMDIQMPVMDGFQAVKAIRELGGKFAELPIIAMTAHTLASDKQKSLDGGMNDHVTKPISPEQFFQAIAHFIKPGAYVVEQSTPTDDLQLPTHFTQINLQAALQRFINDWKVLKKQCCLLHTRMLMIFE